jgi:hypothetical protein
MEIEQFKKILAKGHIYQFLYHFTDSTNLPSIAKHGIVSKREAERLGIKIAAQGGNEWSRDADALKGLTDYVNLCFTQSHPMCHLANIEGRIPNPVYLPIHPDVLQIGGVKITLGVANKSGIELLSVQTGLAQLDTQVLYTRTDWSDPDIQQRLRRAEKCEILVPKAIPLRLINRKL